MHRKEQKDQVILLGSFWNLALPLHPAFIAPLLLRLAQELALEIATLALPPHARPSVEQARNGHYNFDRPRYFLEIITIK